MAYNIFMCINSNTWHWNPQPNRCRGFPSGELVLTSNCSQLHGVMCIIDGFLWLCSSNDLWLHLLLSCTEDSLAFVTCFPLFPPASSCLLAPSGGLVRYLRGFYAWHHPSEHKGPSWSRVFPTKRVIFVIPSGSPPFWCSNYRFHGLSSLVMDYLEFSL